MASDHPTERPHRRLPRTAARKPRRPLQPPPRCPVCDGRLFHFKGRAYCPECERVAPVKPEDA